MKRRILAFAVIAGVMLIAALPAFANHQWTIDIATVVCNATTNTVTFEAYNDGEDSPGYSVDFFADGNSVENVEFYTDDPPFPPAGTYELSYTNPAFTEGVLATVNDGNVEVTVLCEEAPEAAAAFCPNPTPEDFVIRSIPAGALAFFEPSEDAYTGFNLPAGTWYAGTAENGFVEVWIACQANNIFVPAANVVG